VPQEPNVQQATLGVRNFTGIFDLRCVLLVPFCRGTVVAKIIGNNVLGKNAYDDIVSLYVHDEIVDGKKLSEIINMKHENTKYLPGCSLPENVVRSVSFYGLHVSEILVKI